MSKRRKKSRTESGAKRQGAAIRLSANAESRTWWLEALAADPNDPRALAFQYLDSKLLPEAEAAAIRALDLHPGNPDCYYVRCAVAVQLGEYRQAIDSGRRCLELLELPSAATPVQSALTDSPNLRARLYALLGIANEQTGAADSAITHFERAISIQPHNQSAYLGLAWLYRRQNRIPEAEKVVARGSKQCPEATELGMLSAILKPHATVSACMIVKNEEDQLPHCLDSIRDWVDEIVIVDTGSSDKTVEIATSYGARVFHQPWEGDFSKHRNHSLDQATGDWIFIIDADEQFCADDRPKVRAALDSDDVDIISINVFNVYGSDEATTTFLPSIRLFRRRLGLRYEGIVHNTLLLPPNASVARVSARLKHYGYDLSPDKMKQKFERSRALLESQLAADPDNPFALFNYAQLLRGAGENSLELHAPKILESAGRAVSLTNPDDPSQRHIHLMCLDQLGWVNMYLKKYDDAVQYAGRALSLKPDYLDPLLLLGHVYARMQNYDQATQWYTKYLKLQSEYDSSLETENIILMHIDSRAQALYGLAVIAELTNHPDQARELYEQTLAVKSGHLEANANLGRLLLGDGDLAEAKNCFLRQLRTTPDSIDALLGLGYISMQEHAFSDAERYFHQILEIDDHQVMALIRLGQISLRSGSADVARAYFNRASQADPARTVEIAESYSRAGFYREAISYYERPLGRDSGSSENFNDLGNCYFRLGEFDEAERYYRRATETVPVAPSAYRNYGLVLARQGRRSAAVEPFERYLKAGSEDVEIRRLVADFHRADGDPARALPHLEAILKVEALDTDALLALADCYLQMGHKDAAILGYEQVLRFHPGHPAAARRLQELQDPAPTL
ncbi:MAG: tetratricopeptide repeat protein [Candidatus Zixiibacteriota bacterium]